MGIDTYGSKISKQWDENGAANVFHSCIGLKSVFVVLQSPLGESGFLLLITVVVIVVGCV